MRLALPTNSERYGSNLFYSVQKVYELDGGLDVDAEFSSPFHVVRQIAMAALNAIEKEMAIVIPIKNEKLRLLEGVLSVIYHSPICPPSLRKQILEEIFRLKIKKKNQEPEKPRQYPALEGMDFDAALSRVDWQKHGNYFPK
jgi:hypothetical protein